MKIYWLILALVVAVGAAMATSRRSFVQPMPAAAGEGFLTDRWYFSNVTETNNAPFTIGFVGTGERIVDWGDGNTTTTNGSVVIDHIYDSAASNIFSIRETTGTTTRVYFYNLDGLHRLKRILTEPNGMWNLTSFQDSFRACVNLDGDMPSFNVLTNLTRMDGTFNTCSTLTSYPDFTGCTNVNTISGIFNSCGQLVKPMPDISVMYKLVNIISAFSGCLKMPGQLPNINLLTNLKTSNLAFNNCRALTGSYPAMVNLLLLTNIDGTFQNCYGLTNNTMTVADIFGSASRSNLMMSKLCFLIPSGLYTNLLGAADDFIKLEKHPNFTTNIYSTNSSYRMFYFQTNLTDYATMPADWK